MPFIDSAGLERMAGRAIEVGWVGVDVEFDSEKTYHPRLALVQLAVDDSLALIDPLRSAQDLTPLGEIFADPRVTKVLHSPDQDLPILARAVGRRPHGVFDTQLAAALVGLGDGPQMGYASLVKELVGEDVPKGARRTDWMRRPLSDAQIKYALDDVRYLRALWDALRERLRGLGRLEWAEEDAASLSENPALYDGDPRLAWTKVKGASGVTDPSDRTVLAELAAWRELRAERIDRPRRWLLEDRALIDLCRARPRPKDSDALRGLIELTERQSRRWTRDLLAAVRAGADRAQRGDAPRALPPGRLGRKDEALARRLQGLVKAHAKTLGVAAPVLATTSDMRALVVQGPESDIRPLSGWRRREIGEGLLAELSRSPG